MATPIILPRQGQSVESCIISQWNKKVGDAVKTGDVLFSYETDKASFEEAAKADGTLLAIFFDADDDVPVLTTVGVIGQPGEDFATLQPGGAAPAKEKAAAPAKQEAAPAAAQPQDEAAPAGAKTETEGTSGISPRARNTAQRLGLDAAQAQGSGPHSRVIERDIFALQAQGGQAASVKAADSAPAQAPAQAAAPGAASGAPKELTYQDVKLSNVRRVIARAMHDSISSMAQLTHQTSFDATAMMALREGFKNAPEELALPKITVTDVILYAAARVLKQYPEMNAHFLDDRMRLFDHVHLGIAVDTPRGLLVPTLYNADTKTLGQIAGESKEIIKAAQSGNINPDVLSGGTFTVTNLGTLGIEMFTPIINPPQVAILGVNSIVERVRTVGGQLSAYPAMGLSLTYDHRAVDGAPASRFLHSLVLALENIQALMAR